MKTVKIKKISLQGTERVREKQMSISEVREGDYKVL